MQVKVDSESGFSSSGSSMSSKISVVDKQTLKMGTEPISQLIYTSYPVFLLSNFLPQLMKFIEFSLTIRNLGLKSAEQLMLVQPLCDIFAQSVLVAIANATNGYISKNLAKNQVIIANTYLAHYYLCAIVWLIICFIMYFAVFKNLFPDIIIGQYFMIKSSLMALGVMFTSAVYPFLKSENRYFLIITESLVEAALFIFLLIFFYNNPTVSGSGLPSNLTIPGVAYVIASFVCSIWFIVVLFKLPWFEVTYKGALRFNFKRLSPIRPNFILQILAMSLPQILTQIADDLFSLVVVLVIKLQISNQYYSLIQSIRLVMYVRVRSLVKSLITSFSDVFQQLASYNQGIKKITRVYDTFKLVLIYQLALLPIIAIMTGVAQKLCDIELPLVADDITPKNIYVLDESRDAALTGAWSCFFQLFYQLTLQVFFLEGSNWFAVFEQLPSVVYGILFLYFIQQLDGKNAKFYYILVSIDILNFAISVPLIIIQFSKYYRLNKANAGHANQLDAASIKQDRLAETDIVRQSVIVDINRPMDSEEQEKQRSRIAGLNKLFNKTVALRSSKAFLNFKDSVAQRGSELLTGSMVMSARNSQAGSVAGSRGSQALGHRESALFQSVQKDQPKDPDSHQ